MSLRGAISGFGEMAARAHLPSWLSRPGIRIAAIHDPAPARRHHALNSNRGIRVYDELELMLDAEALNFIDIASPPASHGQAVALALEAGVNVIVEKPLCLSLREFRELSALAARSERLLMCVHTWKYSPAYRRAHELISSGRLGKLWHVSLVRLRPFPAGSGGLEGTSHGWRVNSEAGGGILLDHGWHAFYLAQWLMGGGAPISVSGSLGMTPNPAVDDTADVRIQFAGGRTAGIHLTWRAPVRRTSATIIGSEALLEIEGGKVILTDRRAKTEDYSVADAPGDSYHAGWFAGAAADFELALNTGSASEFARDNLREAETAMTLTVGARRSAAQDGRWIDLEVLE